MALAEVVDVFSSEVRRDNTREPGRVRPLSEDEAVATECDKLIWECDCKLPLIADVDFLREANLRAFAASLSLGIPSHLEFTFGIVEGSL